MSRTERSVIIWLRMTTHCPIHQEKWTRLRSQGADKSRNDNIVNVSKIVLGVSEPFAITSKVTLSREIQQATLESSMHKENIK